MRAIVRSAVILCLAALLLYADAHQDTLDLFASAAAALADVNVPKFMEAFDPDMPDYDRLKTDVTALVNQAEVSSSIEPIRDQGDDSKRLVDLDWYLEVRSLLQDGPIIRRREIVHCELQRKNKRWKIVSLEPIQLFAPAALAQ